MNIRSTTGVELSELMGMVSVVPNLELPSPDLVQRVLSLVFSEESPAVANHSIRSYLFASMVGTHLGMTPGREYDGRLLFAACVMHDIGLSAAGDGSQRFEVDGADIAAQLLVESGLSVQDVEAVWESIALHTSAGIAERRSPLCRLVRAGVGVDFGQGAEIVTDTQANAIHAAFPRLDMARTLVDAIVAQAGRTPSKAPAYSIADGLQRERAVAPHTTRLEQLATGACWDA